jgi:hypothetical protein
MDYKKQITTVFDDPYAKYVLSESCTTLHNVPTFGGHRLLAPPSFSLSLPSFNFIFIFNRAMLPLQEW